MKKVNDATNPVVQTQDEVKQTLDQEMRALAKSHSDKKSALKEVLLKERYNTFCQKYKFVPGQIVVWKDDMRNRRNPEYGQPAIVVEVLEKPLMDYPSDERNSAGSAFFNEPLDLGIGILDGDGDWYVLFVDSRRFRPK